MCACDRENSRDSWDHDRGETKFPEAETARKLSITVLNVSRTGLNVFTLTNQPTQTSPCRATRSTSFPSVR